MTTQEIKRKIMPILRRQGVAKVALFGSVVRGEMKKRSDIDMIIEYKGQKGLMDLVRLQFELEEKLGRKVDILTYGSIHPLLKNIILNEQKIIYESRQRQRAML